MTSRSCRAIFGITVALAAVLGPGATSRANARDEGRFYIGTQATQVQLARLDREAGTMTLVEPVAEVQRPTWTVRHPTLPVLYVASPGVAEGEGSVSSFRIDPSTGALTRTGEAKAGGQGTTHLWVDARSRTLLAANYGGGSTATFALAMDGSVQARVSLRKEAGAGPHTRQTSPHAHGVAVDPSGRYALVADLGLDRLFVYRFDQATHALLPDDIAHPRHLVLPPASGPRHFAFSPNGRFVYLLGELSADIHVLRWDARSGTLAPVQTLSTDTPDFAGTKSVAEVAVSKDGRFVYVSNRGESTIVVYATDPRTGVLRLVERVPSGGENPWAFALHPDGRWMIVANQRSDNLALFRVDPATGRLTDTGQKLAVVKPVNISFDR
jgi:6-phosphogluconolactonase